MRGKRLHPPPLPQKRKDNWFGFRGVDQNVVEERVPKLNEWLNTVINTPGINEQRFVQEWLSPLQIGDIKPKEYDKFQ
jgi:hypothetical protein